MIFGAHNFLFSFPFSNESISVFRTIREIGFQAELDSVEADRLRARVEAS